MPNPLSIKLPVFEGPFDLLLHLVRANEMDLHDIAMAEITAQYLDYIERMRELDLEVAGEFLVMAATLLSLKARNLLPVPVDPEEQEEELDEALSAKELVRQLIEYRRFKEAAAHLREREAEALRVAYRNAPPPRPPEKKDEEPKGDLDLLFKAFARVLRYVDAKPYDPNMHGERYSVEEKIAYLEEVLAAALGSAEAVAAVEAATREQEAELAESGAAPRVDLDALLGRCFNREEVIVTFLAVLELCRLKRLAIDQDSPFAPIVLLAKGGDMERAGGEEPHGEVADEPEFEDDGEPVGEDEDDAALGFRKRRRKRGARSGKPGGSRGDAGHASRGRGDANGTGERGDDVVDGGAGVGEWPDGDGGEFILDSGSGDDGRGDSDGGE